MKKFFLFLIPLIIFSFFLTKEAKAGSEQNVSGFAWSENIGWLSLNSKNCDANGDGKSDGTPAGCPPSGTTISNYGVKVDFYNGKISGYAWSENIGWISFNEADTGAPPSNDPCSDSSCIAKAIPFGNLGKNNVPVYGWARALSYGNGWDGWIRFDHNQTNKVYIDEYGDFHGWAWGSDVVGWLSFNCAEGGESGGNICSKSPYKVIFTGIVNHPPQANSLTIDYQSYCGVAPGTGQIGFSWIYQDEDGNSESRFEFQIDNNANFSSPEVNRNFEGLSNPSGSTNNQTVLVTTTLQADKIIYGERYYWQVKVYDGKGGDSGWVSGSNFTTSDYAWPWPDFSWSPERPVLEELVNFTDKSQASGGATIRSWSWTFENGEPLSTTTQNPTVKFLSRGEGNQNKVTLTVTDSRNYSCSCLKSISAELPLPEWKEIPPFLWLKKFFAAVSNLFDGFKGFLFFTGLNMG